MVHLSIDPTLLERVPAFKIGRITYHDITVHETPQMLKSRIQLFYEQEKWKLENQEVSEIEGINEWRQLFKTIGTDPSRYRPSHEALIRRLKKEKAMPDVHSAVDLMNFFSIRHVLPMGLYDLAHITGDTIHLRIGQAGDHYEGINGREMSMEGKLISADEDGAFGSPIVDSRRTMLSERTKNALHLVYIRPSMEVNDAQHLLEELKTQFTQIHSGEAEATLITG